MVRFTNFFRNLGVRGFFVLFLFAIPFFLFFSSCQIDMNCRKPNPNELKNIKSVLFKDGKLVVLSSPQDVLTWCSAFLSVFEYSEGNLRFLRNIELSGKIAHDMVWVDKSLAVLISSSDRQVIDVVDPDVGKVVSSFSPDLQNIKLISSYGKSLLVLPNLDQKVFFVEDVSDFIISKSGKYFNLNFFPKSGIVGDVEGQKYIFIIPQNTNDGLFVVIFQNGVIQSANISEGYSLVDVFQYGGAISTIQSQIKSSPRLSLLGSNLVFNSKMFFRDGFLFIHANLGDMKGIFVYNVRCINEPIQNCSWLVPITSESLDDVFVFSPINYGDNLKVFPVIYSITSDVGGKGEKRQNSFISLLVLNEGKFYFVDKKIVSSSQIYDLVGYDISEYKMELNSSVSENKKVSSTKNTYSDKFSNSDGGVSKESQNAYESKKGISLKIKFVFKENEYDNIRFFEYETNLLLNQ
jgi:hypothetical protein